MGISGVLDWLAGYLVERPFLHSDHRRRGVCLTPDHRRWHRQLYALQYALGYIRVHCGLAAFVITCSWREFRMKSLLLLSCYVYGIQESYCTYSHTICQHFMLLNIVFYTPELFHLINICWFGAWNCPVGELYWMAVLLRQTWPNFPGWSCSDQGRGSQGFGLILCSFPDVYK